MIEGFAFVALIGALIFLAFRLIDRYPKTAFVLLFGAMVAYGFLISLIG